MTDEPLRAAIDRMLIEAYAQMQPYVGEALGGAKPGLTVSSAKKYYAMLPMSLDEMVDTGAITEEDARAQGWTPYVPPPIPWYRRLRWRWQAWRERAGRKIGSWIAGVDLSERDEDW